MIFETFLSRRDMRPAIKSTASNKDARRRTGSQCPVLALVFRKLGYIDAAGAFRAIYISKFADAVYVLHCFQKKSQKTSRTDLALAEKRYRDLIKERAL
jgi:phage-related protein